MHKSFSLPGISVIMPSFNYGCFIRRAIESLKKQRFENWELIIINDGSTDQTEIVIQEYMYDPRIRYLVNPENQGLGACLNKGIANARFEFIAYLPADDIFYEDHLQSLWNKMNEHPEAVLVYSGVRYLYNKTSTGLIDQFPLQLVQVLHKKCDKPWVERNELVTDSLERMYWSKLREEGTFEQTLSITCEWVDHPLQRHKIIREPIGGINPYKLHYGVKQPLRFHSTVGNYIDEVSYYKVFRDRPYTVPHQQSLKILIVGELAYNPERILALEEQGHQLYGLWTREPYWYNFIGPLPFGRVQDIPYDQWELHVEQIKPDVIYALLNWQAVPFAREVLLKTRHIPFVWHFKEGPFICLEKGTWPALIDLHTISDGQIYSSPEMRMWFEQFIPESSRRSFVLDGDLPKREWFTEERSALLSDKEGGIHTVVPGRPIGLHPSTVEELSQHNIHLHFYGDFTQGQWQAWIRKTMGMAPGFLHIHPNCSQESWVKEFSQYDAGWLHFFHSENNGELMRANWDDLNYPARMATLAMAGVPMLQRNNDCHIVATQRLVKEHGLGIFFKDIEELASQLSDKKLVNEIRNQVWRKRRLFCFDEHVPDLVDFFRKVIDQKFLHHQRIVPSQQQKENKRESLNVL